MEARKAGSAERLLPAVQKKALLSVALSATPSSFQSLLMPPASSTSTLAPNTRRSGCTRLFFTTGGLLAVLLLATVTLTHGEEPEAIFDKKLAESYEPAALIEGTTSGDGRLSVIFVARKKNLKPAKWPSIIPEVSINGTSVSDEDHTQENWIVSTNEKKRLGLISSKEETYLPHHDGKNHCDLSVLWGPDQEGWHYGVLNYTGRWGCNDIFFVNCDGEKAYATSMRALLNKNATKLLTAQKKDPARFEIMYELLGAVEPETSATVSDPLTLRLVFIAQVPKSDEDDDYAEGTITLKLSRDEKGVSTATVLSVKPGRVE